MDTYTIKKSLCIVNERKTTVRIHRSCMEYETWLIVIVNPENCVCFRRPYISVNRLKI